MTPQATHQRLILAGALLLAGCDGSAIVGSALDERIRKCQAAGMDIRVYWTTMPDSVRNVECVPAPKTVGENRE
jgi:hypothetical protein